MLPKRPEIPRPGPDPTETLVARCQAGDEQAWQELYRLHAPTTARFLKCILGPGPEIDDLVQEVFSRLVGCLGQFRPGPRFTTWLYGIASNVAREHARGEARRIRRSLAFLAWSSGSTAPDPIEAMEAREDVATILAALEGMSLANRTVWVLGELEGLPSDEIGRALQTTAITVRVRLMRARRIVVRALLDSGSDRPLGPPRDLAEET